MYFRDYKHKYSWNIAGSVITCTAVSHVRIFGRVVLVKGIGIARCRNDDIFKEDFGKELSKIRAKAELFRKIENIFIDETKKSSWRKPEVDINQGIFRQAIEQANLYVNTRALRNITAINICDIDGKVLGTVKVEE